MMIIVLRKNSSEINKHLLKSFSSLQLFSWIILVPRKNEGLFIY